MIIVTATLDGVTQPINGQGQYIKGTISQEVGAINSFTFDILPNNKGFDLIQSRKTIIKAVNNVTGRVEFSGRVLLAEEKMENTGLIFKSVTCESWLAILYDSIQPYRAESTMTLSEFLNIIIANHNAQTEPSKHLQLGTVNVEVAGTGNVTKGLQYETTYDTIKSKLVDIYGGELELVEIEGGAGFTLNYVKEIGTTRSTAIELGRNMQQASREISPLNIITRVIPLGAKKKEQVVNDDGSVTEVETEERLTLEGYTPAGADTALTVPWLDDTEKINAYGVIVGTLDFPDITEQFNLYSRAIEFFTKENRLELAHTLTALDLKEIGQALDSLNCGDSYPVKNKLIGLDEILRITKKSFDINSPYKGSITIGEKKATLSNIQAGNNAAIKDFENSFTEIKNEFAESSRDILNTTVRLEAQLGVTEEQVAALAEREVVTKTEFDTLTENIETRFTQTAEAITTEFTKTAEKITEVETEFGKRVESEFKELNAYIRYYMTEDSKPVIELGSGGNDLICKILNDRISFTENGIEVAYISDNQLYITNATILSRLNIGNMSFLRRKNGNLSLVLNGG